MTEQAKHTPGPYSFRFYMTDDDPTKLRDLGIDPVRALTNDGQIAIMAPDEERGAKRIALVDCQIKFKRGTGYKTNCAERDANARLFAAAPDLLTALIKLTNEVLGSLPLMEPLARREFGNTNYQLIIQRAEESLATIAKAKGRS